MTANKWQMKVLFAQSVGSNNDSSTMSEEGKQFWLSNISTTMSPCSNTWAQKRKQIISFPTSKEILGTPTTFAHSTCATKTKRIHFSRCPSHVKSTVRYLVSISIIIITSDTSYVTPASMSLGRVISLPCPPYKLDICAAHALSTFIILITWSCVF